MIRLLAITLIPLTLFAFIAHVGRAHAQEARSYGAQAPPAGTHTIFRCEIAGVPTFSDRPCASAVQFPTAESASVEPDTVELGTINILKSPTAVAASPSTSAAKQLPPRTTAASQRSTAASRNSKADACGRIEQSLRKIASKMRSGYRAKEGERLRQRKEELEQKRQARRC